MPKVGLALIIWPIFQGGLVVSREQLSGLSRVSSPAVHSYFRSFLKEKECHFICNDTRLNFK